MADTLTIPDLLTTQVPGTDPGLAAALTAAKLPIEDLADPGRTFFAFQTATGEPCGYGGYEIHGAHALIRSMVVPEALRRTGLGRVMLAQLLARSVAEGARDAWLFTSKAAPFFSRQGFHAVARYEAPPEIMATKQATSVCPISAQIMTRSLSR